MADKWQEAVITNAGISMLGEVLSGGELVISRAALGGGTVDTAALMSQTGLADPLSVVPVISQKKLVEGKGIDVKLQIGNSGVSVTQTMKQVGLYAKIGDGAEKLFAIMQDGIGEEIPSVASYPDFMIEFTAAVAVSNTDGITVRISGSAVVTAEILEERLKEKASVDHTHDTATSAASGFMSAADKAKLDGISDSADSVSIVPALTAGTKIGTITINGVAVDLYCQTNTDTKYSPGAGITISGTTISNSGVRSVASGSANGTIAVNAGGTSANVAVKGLASAAYQAVQTAAGAVGLHRISSGTAAATTTNCPAGCWYGKHD